MENRRWNRALAADRTDSSARTAGSHTARRTTAAPTRNMKAANQAKRTWPNRKARFGFLEPAGSSTRGVVPEAAPTLNWNCPDSVWPSSDRACQPTAYEPAFNDGRAMTRSRPPSTPRRGPAWTCWPSGATSFTLLKWVATRSEKWRRTVAGAVRTTPPTGGSVPSRTA